MPRQPRIVVPNEPMHIVQRGNNRQDIFRSDSDYTRLKEDLAFALKHSGCQLHAYVLMTNHVHLLITPPTEKALSMLMQSLGRRYVQYFNNEYGRSGTLWEGRYKSSLIDSAYYLLACYRYIEENPVRADMVEQPDDYRWSSYHANALGKEDELLTPHREYLSLSEQDDSRRNEYQNLFEHRLAPKVITQFNQCAERGEVVGREAYHQKIANLLGIKTRKMQHGGDRKSSEFISSSLTP